VAAGGRACSLTTVQCGATLALSRADYRSNEVVQGGEFSEVCADLFTNPAKHDCRHAERNPKALKVPR
jgi:hypothetical protein